MQYNYLIPARQNSFCFAFCRALCASSWHHHFLLHPSQAQTAFSHHYVIRWMSTHLHCCRTTQGGLADDLYLFSVNYYFVNFLWWTVNICIHILWDYWIMLSQEYWGMLLRHCIANVLRHNFASECIQSDTRTAHKHRELQCMLVYCASSCMWWCDAHRLPKDVTSRFSSSALNFLVRTHLGDFITSRLEEIIHFTSRFSSSALNSLVRTDLGDFITSRLEELIHLMEINTAHSHEILRGILI